MSFWHQLPQPIIGLAPMDGVTDSVFRQLVAHQAKPDVIFTEFTNVGDICRGRGAGLDSLRYSEMERPIIAQIYGKDPELFFQAAQVIGALGFDGLDINMGCPSKNVASSGSGAGLIRTPELALQIIEASRKGLEHWANGSPLSNIGIKPRLINTIHEANLKRGTETELLPRRRIPLSVKTRLGYNEDIIEEWSECLIQGNPEVISIHGRTLSQMYRGRSNWESIALAARRIRSQGILVFGNGDIVSLDDASQRIRQAAVHGALIGRAALGNPWIFQDLQGFRKIFNQGDKEEIPEIPIGLEDRFQKMLEHSRLFEKLNGTEKFHRMRKHLAWYCSSFPHAAALRAQMVRTKSSQDVAKILHDYSASQAAKPELAEASVV